MKRRTRQLQVVAAEQRLGIARAGLHASMSQLRTRLRRHGPATLIGTGLASGAAAGLLPLRALGSVARMLMNTGLLLLRFPTRALLDIARMHDRTPPTEHTQ
jgi:hypothetical protein